MAILIVSLISSTLSQIFRVAVYEYAVSGRAPGHFDAQLLQSAVKSHALTNRDTRVDLISGHPL